MDKFLQNCCKKCCKNTWLGFKNCMQVHRILSLLFSDLCWGRKSQANSNVGGHGGSWGIIHRHMRWKVPYAQNFKDDAATAHWDRSSKNVSFNSFENFNAYSNCYLAIQSERKEVELTSIKICGSDFWHAKTIVYLPLWTFELTQDPNKSSRNLHSDIWAERVMRISNYFLLNIGSK